MHDHETITTIDPRTIVDLGTGNATGLRLSTDEAQSLIVWLMTDHKISAVVRDTPDGDVFTFEEE
jgi:hypothetical protein